MFDAVFVSLMTQIVSLDDSIPCVAKRYLMGKKAYQWRHGVGWGRIFKARDALKSYALSRELFLLADS